MGQRKLFLALVSSGVFALLFLGDRGLLSLFSIHHAKKNLEEKIQELTLQNQELHQRIWALNHDEATIQDTVRETLGLIRGDEIIFERKTQVSATD